MKENIKNLDGLVSGLKALYPEFKFMKSTSEDFHIKMVIPKKKDSPMTIYKDLVILFDLITDPSDELDTTEMVINSYLHMHRSSEHTVGGCASLRSYKGYSMFIEDLGIIRNCHKDGETGIEEVMDYLYGVSNLTEDFQFPSISPFVDARLVSDYTFATRLLGFLDDLRGRDIDRLGPHWEEEFDYFTSVGKELLKYQYLTADDKSELEYLDRLNTLNKLNIKQSNEDSNSIS